MKKFFTSEAVLEGHPDKICDIIADSILDEALKVDKNSHMAVEATIKDDIIFIYGEAKTKAIIDYGKIAKKTLKDIGYLEDYKIIIKISEQSKEINDSVAKNKICAGDQGIMFGFACRETEELMPFSIVLANKLAMEITKLRKSNQNTFLKPDGKTQVTVEYDDNVIKRIDTILIAVQHSEETTIAELRKYIIENVINKVIPDNLIDAETKILINTSGKFTIGGSFGDSGTTGRKIVVDTYGGHARIGGGCLSSKDPTKVDRSAAYYARYVAKNIVYNDLCTKCEIEVAYAIGMEKPISIFIETFGTEKVELETIYKFVNDNFNFSVDNIIKELDLLRPIYKQVACYGHFGRPDLNLTWEQVKNIKNS